ncbi:MAG: LamG domain-containing protein [Akkermansiaceae bacterium]|nr:LamG domain-containing protein [Akkermansiaceae bacterium]
MKIRTHLLTAVACSVLMPASANAALLLHYTYESGTISGGTVNDQSPGGTADGVRSGGGSFAVSTTAIEGTQSLNNTTSIAINKGPLDSTSNEATIASWYKGTDSSGYFFDQGQDRFVSSVARNTASFAVWRGGTWYDSGVSTSIIADDEWHHIAFVWSHDGTDATATIYVDGTAIDWGGGATTKTLTGKGKISLTNDGIGAYQRLFSGNTGATQDQLNGLFDDTRIYDTALSASEIASLAGVPEPSSAALLGLGGLALILRRRKG